MVKLNLMVELAGLEEELADARARIAHHERRDGHLRALQKEYVSDAADAEADGRSTEVALRLTEGRIKAVEAALLRKRGQAGGLGDRRQYLALQAEIGNLAEELDRLETAGLALLEEVRRLDGEAGQVRGECEAQEVSGTQEIDRMTREVEMARAAEQEILPQIDCLTGMLPAGESRHVKRLMSRGSQAVVRIQSGACGGCFSQLPVQQAIDAEQGRALVRCGSCARYVVHKAWK